MNKREINGHLYRISQEIKRFDYEKVKKNNTIYPRLSIEIFDIRNELSTDSNKIRLNSGKKVQHHIDERYIRYRSKENEHFDLFEYIRLTTGTIENINDLAHGVNDQIIKNNIYI